MFWPRLTDEQWLLLAAARPPAHQLATASGHDVMLRILDFAYGLGVTLPPR